MLQVACDRNGGYVDAEKASEIKDIEESQSRSIAALYIESMFQSRASPEGDGIDDNLEAAKFWLD